MGSTINSILKKTLSLAGAIFASRVLGFIRELLMAAVFGGGAITSAWTFSLKIPNLFRRVFGEGLIGTVLIPIISQTIEKSGRESARRQFSTVFLWVTLLLSLCTILVSSLAMLAEHIPYIAEKSHLLMACHLIPLVMPYCIFICLIGIMTSILNSIKLFFWPAVLSLLLNLFIIGGLCLIYLTEISASLDKLQVLGWAVLLSGILEFAGMLILLKRNGFLPEISKELFCQKGTLFEVGSLALPGLAGAIAYQFSVFSDALIAGWISEYAVASLNFTERLVYLPIGVLGFALGTVSLPEMSRMAQHRAYEDLISTLFSALRYLCFLTIPLTVYFIIFHVPILSLAYCRGNFGTRALTETAMAMGVYVFGIPAFAATKIILPGFYSRKDMKTPMYVSICCIILNLILNLILMHPLKQGGIALATVLSAYLNNILLLLLLRKQLGELPFSGFFKMLAKTILASLAAWYPALWVFRLLSNWTKAVSGTDFFLSLLISGLVFLAIFLIIAILLRIEEINQLTRRIKKRKGA